MKGLIIKDPWIDLILDRLKTWEIRGSNTIHRGHTELIKSTTGLRHGKADLIGTKQLSPLDMHYYYDKHQVTDEVSYPKIWAWIFENAEWHAEPIPYEHKRGCVIWVNL